MSVGKCSLLLHETKVSIKTLWAEETVGAGPRYLRFSGGPYEQELRRVAAWTCAWRIDGTWAKDSPSCVCGENKSISPSSPFSPIPHGFVDRYHSAQILHLRGGWPLDVPPSASRIKG